LTGTLCSIKDHLRYLHFNAVLVHSTVQTHIRTVLRSSGLNQFFYLSLLHKKRQVCGIIVYPL
jgi:hypothetical protein